MNSPVNEATVEALPEARRLPVFVSTGKRRGRMFRLVGYGLAALTALWLIALLAGAVGLSRLPAVPLPQLANTDDPAVQPRKDPIEPTGKARKPSSPPIAARPPCCSTRSHPTSRRPSARRAAPPAGTRQHLAPGTTRRAGPTQPPDAAKSPVPDAAPVPTDPPAAPSPDAAPVRTDVPAAPSPDPSPNTTESSVPIAPDPSPEPSREWRPPGG
jgi:hypothetical protein